MGKRAPNPQAHVRHFLSTVEDYEQFAVLHPLGNSINMWGHRDDAGRRWLVVTHAMLLRKYFATTDQLWLPEVIRSLQRCVVAGDLPPERWAEILELVSKPPPGISLGYVGDEEFDAEAVLDYELYGRYLHGDYDKWATSQRVKQITDTNLFSAVGARAARVGDITALIRHGVAQGFVNLDE